MEVAADEEVTTFDASFGDQAREWLATVYAAMERMPAGKLFSLLRPSTTVQLVNQAKAFVEQAFQWQDRPLPSKSQTPDHDNSSMGDQTFFLARCSLYLYYRVLQGLLCSISGTNRRSSSTVSAKVIALARNQPLQYALLTCAVEVTCFCGTGQASFPSIASALGQAPAALDLWEAAQHFLFFLAAETAMPLADSVGSYLIFMRMRVMEDLAWRTGSTLYSAICNGGGASCKQGDYALVSAFLESVAALARTRVTGTAAGVMHHIMALNEVAAFQEECIWLMDIVLQEHLDLLFNQHLSNIAACCVYGVARVYGAALTFKKVVDTVIATFPHHTVEDFKQAELQPADEQAEAQYGDTRQLYNEVFLPRMDTVLQQKFAGAQQKNKRSCVDIGKEKQETHKRALKALSAADVNARPGRFHRMQT